MDRPTALHLVCAFAAGGVLGASWLLTDGLLGPCASFALIPLVAWQREAAGRFAAAFGYYACGSVPIIAAVVGYWGADHAALGVAAWLGASLLLAVPWMLAARGGGAFGSLALTALPPLGVIGWLSPLNSAGALFPGTSWFGLALLCIGVAAMYGPAHRPRLALLAALGFTALASNLIYRRPAPPRGWTGVTTSLKPARGNVFDDIRNNQDAIRAGITQGKGARIVVFPEAILDDWLPGTRQQFALGVPNGQLWILGADTHSSDAVVAALHGNADEHVLARSAGLLIGGNWLPGSQQTLRPAWWERVFYVQHGSVWVALCVEQVQPWTWLEAMLQRPDVIFAMSNGWWTRGAALTPLPAGEAALSIERASSRAWTRLMDRPVVWAVNQ